MNLSCLPAEPKDISQAEKRKQQKGWVGVLVKAMEVTGAFALASFCLLSILFPCQNEIMEVEKRIRNIL